MACFIAKLSLATGSYKARDHFVSLASTAALHNSSQLRGKLINYEYNHHKIISCRT